MKNPEKLLDLLAQDARLTPAQLAAMLGETEEDVAAAIKAYEKNSTILGYKTVVDWDKTSKESVTALIEVKITPQKGMGFDEIARQIYSHHQVESVYLMSGGFDLTVIIKGRTMREQYDLRRRYLLGELRSMGLECFEPQGAFYMFPSIESTGLSSDEFCERLLHEQEVAVIPGSAFGESGEGHVRISYSYSMNHLREACSRIRKFLQTL